MTFVWHLQIETMFKILFKMVMGMIGRKTFVFSPGRSIVVFRSLSNGVNIVDY